MFFLIPKFENPLTTNHFHLLGLCTTHYKILAKILVNQLRSHLQKLIIKSRHIVDLFLLAQETLYSMNNSKSKIGWIILKLHIKKVFDTISWSFILDVLKVFNFPSQWIFASHKWNTLLYSKAQKLLPLNLVEELDRETPYLLTFSLWQWNISPSKLP